MSDRTEEFLSAVSVFRSTLTASGDEESKAVSAKFGSQQHSSLLLQQKPEPTRRETSEFLQIAASVVVGFEGTSKLIERMKKLVGRKGFSNNPAAEISDVMALFEGDMAELQRDIASLQRYADGQSRGYPPPNSQRQKHCQHIVSTLRHSAQEHTKAFRDALLLRAAVEKQQNDRQRIFSHSVGVTPAVQLDYPMFGGGGNAYNNANGLRARKMRRPAAQNPQSQLAYPPPAPPRGGEDGRPPPPAFGGGGVGGNNRADSSIEIPQFTPYGPSIPPKGAVGPSADRVSLESMKDWSEKRGGSQSPDSWGGSTGGNGVRNAQDADRRSTIGAGPLESVTGSTVSRFGSDKSLLSMHGSYAGGVRGRDSAPGGGAYAAGGYGGVAGVGEKRDVVIPVPLTEPYRGGTGSFGLRKIRKGVGREDRADAEEEEDEARRAAWQVQVQDESKKRAEESHKVEKMISELGQMFSRFSSMVAAQEEVVMHIEDDVEAAHAFAEEGQAHLAKYYQVMSGNRGIIIKIFVLLIVFIWIFLGLMK